MGARREGREAAVQFLFQRDLNPGTVEELAPQFWVLRPAPSAKVRAFAETLVRGVVDHQTEIDGRIQRHAENYQLKRIATVDRNILRVALFEMWFCPDVPPVVAINEAIEIAKALGGEESGGFVNGILDRARTELDRPARTAGLARGFTTLLAALAATAPLILVPPTARSAPAPPPAAATAARRPNIIFVLADDQTPAYLSCYGGRTPTPNLDRLAKEGARFTNAHSATPLCNPTRYTILTGQFAGRNAHVAAGAVPGEAAVVLQNTQLDPDTPCVAEMLRDAGYRTGFVGKWHSNFEYEALGAGKLPPLPPDPDAPDADALLAERQRVLAATVKAAARFDEVSHVVLGNAHGTWPIVHNPEWLTDGAVAFMEHAAAAKRPFFLHLADTIPHAPDVCAVFEVDPRYTLDGKLDAPPASHPPRATIKERLQAAGLPVSSQQVGAIMLDDQIGALLAALRRLGLDDNTLVVFAQDNGQIGKGSCYSGGSQAALVMRWPRGIKAGTVIDTPVSFVDFVPTFLAMAGASGPAGYRPDGVDLTPVLAGTGTLARAAIYCEAGVARSVIKGDFRYLAFRPTPSQIAAMEGGKAKAAFDTWGRERGGDNTWLMPYKPGFFDPDQLYDRRRDPLERHNLAADPAYATVLADLRAELERYLETMPTPFPLAISPFVASDRYAKLVAARRAAAAMGNYWPQYPAEDWERNLNLNLKSPEEIDPAHPSAWQPGKKGR